MSTIVVNKDNNEQFTVYDITYDKAGYPHFLVYKDGQWVRMSAKHFRPFNADDFMFNFKNNYKFMFNFKNNYKNSMHYDAILNDVVLDENILAF